MFNIRFTKKSEQERLHINLARIKKNGKNFEIVVDPDKAILFKEGKLEDVREVLVAERIFENAQKGLFSPESDLKITFGTLDSDEIAELILRKGDLQLSSHYRERLRVEKRRKLIELIHRNAINPTNNFPHPLVRIENAFEEAKITIDDKKSAEDQLNEIIKRLKPILPIKIEQKHVQIHISEHYAKKYYKAIHNYGIVFKENWLDDGCYQCIISIPAGIYLDLVDDLSRKTHGGVDIRVIDENNRV